MAREMDREPSRRDFLSKRTTRMGELILNLNAKRRRTAGFLLASLALSGANALADASSFDLKSTPHLDYVGVSSNQLWTTDREQAIAAGAKIRAMGGNTVRIVVPESRGQSEIRNDYPLYCNFGESVAENDLTPEITLTGIFPIDQSQLDEPWRLAIKERYGTFGTKGYLPSTLTGYKHAAKTMGDILYAIETDPNCNGTLAGHQPPSKVLVGYFNEVNYNLFVKNQKDAPRNYTNGLRYFYPAVHRTADKLDIDVEVVAGDFSSTHAPAKFTIKMEQYMKLKGIKAPIADILGEHPYPAQNTESPSEVMLRQYASAYKAAQWLMGEDVKIIYDEFGNHTSIPSGIAQKYYTKIVVPRGGLISSQQQDKNIAQSFKTAAGLKDVVGWLNFQLDDDGSTGQTGLDYEDGRRKAPLGLASKAMRRYAFTTSSTSSSTH